VYKIYLRYPRVYPFLYKKSYKSVNRYARILARGWIAISKCINYRSSVIMSNVQI